MQLCSLCNLSIQSLSHRDGEHLFCCQGCRVVFNILLSKNEKIENFKETDLFKKAISAGLISNPLLLEKSKNEMTNASFERLPIEILEMWCPSCAEVIALILNQEKGIKKCVVDYATDLSTIEYYPQYISKEKIFSLIKDLGYQPYFLNTFKGKVSKSLTWGFIIAAFCSLNIMMLASPLYVTYFYENTTEYSFLFAILSLIFSLPVLFFSFTPILKRFVSSLKVGLYGMETLVVIGVLSSCLLSFYNLLLGNTQVYFDSMTVIITFVLLGKIIETKAKFSAKEALIHLEHALPKRGRVISRNGIYYVPLKEIKVGDTILANRGEKIVLDGLIEEGKGFVDESFMTGEALPLHKKNNDRVVAGSLLLEGSIRYKVTKYFQESAYNKIIEQVREDIGSKVFYIRPVDPIVKIFVPIVLLLSCFGVIVGGFSRALSILLISCPCAIGIAAPLAESYIISGISSLGAIIRNRGVLPLLSKESVFVFDKTGTVTEGKFSVLEALNFTREDFILAKSITQHSNHPISQAIFNFIDHEIVLLSEVEEIAGKGLKAVYKGELVYLGSKKFLEDEGLMVNISLSSDDLTSYAYFAYKQKISLFVLGDKVKEEMPELIKALHPAKTILLSGDSEEAVFKVAKKCQFDEWVFSQDPLQKRSFIEKLKNDGHTVCMIGDGINDAPSLTAAHIGISVVSASDISIHVSDILLTNPKLTTLLAIRKMAKKGKKIIYQNLFWAFFYNILGLGLALFGYLNPLFAAFAMITSSLIVLFNAKRIN